MVTEHINDQLVLVGTAHVSPESVREVQAAIEEFKPTIVAVELDAGRLEALEDKQRWLSTPIHKLLKGDKLWLFLTQVMLASYQRRLGEVYGAEPGTEMLAAVIAGREMNAQIHLVDRDVSITMKRAVRSMRFKEKFRLSWELFKALFGGDAEEEDTTTAERPARSPQDEAPLRRLREHAQSTREMGRNATLTGIAAGLISGFYFFRDKPPAIWWTLALVATALIALGLNLWVLNAYYRRRAESLEGPALPPAAKKKPPSIQDLTQEDTVSTMMKELGQIAPSIKSVVLDERDAYLATRIQEVMATPRLSHKLWNERERPHRVLAVIGAGHLPGIRKRIQDQTPPADLRALEVIPDKGIHWGKIVFGWGMPAAIILLFAYLGYQGIQEGKLDKLRDAFVAWTLITGSFAALGAALARGHILSILTSFIAAPITTLHPALAAGWFAGLVEAWVRTPTVLDFQSLSQLKDMKAFFGNRVIRVLMVAALANLGAMAGFWLASWQVFRIFQGA